MKITLGDKLKIREEEDRIIHHLRTAGRSLREVDTFTRDFQRFLSSPEVVEMHVFLDGREVREAEVQSPVLRKALAMNANRILAKIERDGFCIGSATKKVARSQLRQTSARA